MTLTGKTAAPNAALAADEALVPQPAAVGQDGAVSDAHREARRRARRSSMSPAREALRSNCSPKGPAPDWALPVPSPVAGAPAGQQRFAFELDGLPPGAKPDGATLKLTAVAGENAIEVPYRLD